MNDEQGDGSEIFQAYAVSCDAELAAKLVPGAKVKVTAKITHYYSPADDKHPEELHVYETVGSGAVEILEEAAVEDITSNVPATKFFRNGQIFLLRNGVLYNMQGQIAE